MRITYRFKLEDGSTRSHGVALDSGWKGLDPDARDRLPSWTGLSFRRCVDCPLDPAHDETCPLAAALVDVVDLCADLGSFERVDVSVSLPEREVRARTSIQHAVGSLIGLITATSGCPRAQFLRPMALFHLPLAGERETIYRATSMYLLSQYFVHRRGGAPDLELAGLRAAYEGMQKVNAGIAGRLRAAFEQDGVMNAIVMLDAFAKILPDVIEGSLHELQPLFEPLTAAIDGPEIRS